MIDLTDVFDGDGPETDLLEEALLDAFGCDGDIERVDAVALLDRGPAPDPSRELMVIVHPGDYDGDAAAQEIAASEILCAAGPDLDVVAVRRESCALAGSSALSDTLDRVCAPKGAARVYYDPSTADSLEGIARDMFDACALVRRPGVVFVGAYADPDHGCVSALWRALVALGLPPERVSLMPCCLTSCGWIDTPDGPSPGLVEGASHDDEAEDADEDGTDRDAA